MTRLHATAMWFGVDPNDVDRWVAASGDDEDVRWLLLEKQVEEHDDDE